MPRKAKFDEPISSQFPPVKSSEAREEQLTALAMDVAEKQMREGTASPLVISHFLKLGTARAKLESERIRKESELASAKAAMLGQQEDIGKLVKEVKDMLVAYSPTQSDIEGDVEYYNPNEELY